jgi:hypothetical protein
LFRTHVRQEIVMANIKMRVGWMLATAIAAGVLVLGTGHPGWDGSRVALAASAQQKSEGRQALRQVTTSLRGVDTAYASGNSAEAQTRFEEARSAWNRVAPMISAREAREAQLLFDSLGSKLKSNAPATKVKSTVAGMLGEFREDIERELR